MEASTLNKEQSFLFKLWQTRGFLEVHSLDRWVQNWIIWPQSQALCLENSQHCISRKELPTVKRGGGKVKVWACFSASGPGQQYYWKPWILRPFNKVFIPVIGVELGQKWSVQQVQQWPKAFQQNFKRKKIHTLYWPSQCQFANLYFVWWLIIFFCLCTHYFQLG